MLQLRRLCPQVSTQWLMAAMRGRPGEHVQQGELTVEALKVEQEDARTMGELRVEVLMVEWEDGLVLVLLLVGLRPVSGRRMTRNGPLT